MKKSPKREAILNTAEKLFYHNGFHATGVKSILDQAGVAPMTMYYHFESKEDVIKEILIQREKQYFQLFEGRINRKSGIKQYVESLIRAHLDWLETDGFNGCLFLRAKQEYEGVNEEIAALGKEHKKAVLKHIENDLRIFQASESFGAQIFIMLEGLTSAAQILDIKELTKNSTDLMNKILVSKS
jgi:AcrR family transcriptional regulator